MVEQTDFNFEKVLTDSLHVLDSTEELTGFWSEQGQYLSFVIVAIILISILILGYLAFWIFIKKVKN